MTTDDSLRRGSIHIEVDADDSENSATLCQYHSDGKTNISSGRFCFDLLPVENERSRAKW